MVYLADWKSAIDRGLQLTGIRWTFHYYGPYVDDVYVIALTDPAFAVVATTNYRGSPKQEIRLAAAAGQLDLSSQEVAILDHVIEQTKLLNFDGFIQLVYSTFPVITGVRGAQLNLVESAGRYRAQIAAQEQRQTAAA